VPPVHNYLFAITDNCSTFFEYKYIFTVCLCLSLDRMVVEIMKL